VAADLPIVLLARDSEERRRGLRLGLTDVVGAPYDAEEMTLMCRLALDRARSLQRDARELTGSLEMLPACDLIQTLEAGRRSAVISLRAGARSATLWMREGQLCDALTSSGLQGESALFEALSWNDGGFVVAFGPVGTPDRLGGSTTGMLLEWTRRSDEAAARGGTPFAALPDPPPLPPRELMAAHRALTLLNVASAYAANYAEPGLLAARLEQTRSDTLARHPVLACLQLNAHGQVSMDALPSAPPEALVDAAAAWALQFFRRMERAFPGRFAPARLRHLTEAVRDDMQSLGFDRCLDQSTLEETR
jgi:hypothetical protein